MTEPLNDGGPVFAVVSWRILATLIDILVAGAILIAVGLVVGEFSTTIITLSAAAIWLAYATVEGRRGGTPGKLALGLRVTLADGFTSPIGLRRAATRRLPDFVGSVPVIGQLLAVALGAASIVMVRRDTAQRRSPYDWVSDTRVVVRPTPPPRRPG